MIPQISRDRLPSIWRESLPAVAEPEDIDESAQRIYEGLVKRYSRKEPGLVTTYFRQNTQIDTELIPVADAVDIILSLYTLKIMDLLATEGQYRHLIGDGDIAKVFGHRSNRIRQGVWNALVAYQETIKEIRTRGSTALAVQDVSDLVHRDRSWYEVLGVDETNASFDEIQAVYRHKIAQYHPDRVAGLGPELQALAEQHSKEINRAYAEARKSRG
jgi:DnaJ-domain-containing protein 1